jgi:APA family basic amino acid/polyamine antiporter
MNKESKKIGLWQTTSLVTGNLVGSGVFMLPALLASFGTISIFGWILTSLGAIFLALVYASLSEKIHASNGGPHTFVQAAFGHDAAFFTAWGYWILTWSSNTALLVAAMSYLVKITGPLSMIHILLLQVSTWSLITIINCKGVQAAARFELTVTVLKLIPIIVIPLVAVFYLEGANFKPWLSSSSSSSWSALQSSVFLTLWAFIGVESATVPSKDVDNPAKTIGRATIMGTSLAALVYILGSIAAIGVLSNPVLMQSQAPYADLAGAVFGGNWGVFVSGCAVVSCVGSLNGWTMVVARIAQGAADQGLFPVIFSRKDSLGTPVAGILISSACTLLCILLTLQENMLSQFNVIVDIAITIILMIYVMCSCAYFVICQPKNGIQKMIGIGALVFSLFSLYASGVKMLLLAFLLLLTGIPFRGRLCSSIFSS